MPSRHNSALAPEWFGQADSDAVDALYHELLALPPDEQMQKLRDNAARDLDRAFVTAAENIYANEGDDE